MKGTDELILEIKTELVKAAKERKKTETFHSLVILHADELAEVDPNEFCRRTDLSPPYATEFRKMVAARRRLREMGFNITPIGSAG